MKNSIILFTCLMLGCVKANAQKLEKPKIDKITGDTTYFTSTERVYSKLTWVGPRR